MSEPLAAVAGFAIQSLAGVLSFLSIYMAALALGAVLKRLNALFGAEAWLEGVGEFVERVLVYVDVGLFMLFLGMEIAKYVRRLASEWRAE